MSQRGLSAAEVDAAVAAGHVNVQLQRSSRSYLDIVRGNVFTRFNAIITVLAAVVLAVGHPIDAIFAIVMVFNTVIGIVQEARAKRTLDTLQILVTPTVVAIRDGAEVDVRPAELVLGDVVRLRVGDQVPFDGEVLAASGLGVDESALTGESVPLDKGPGDQVMSGSVVVGGGAVVRATAVGTDTWIYDLISQAKEFALSTSELRRGVDRILAAISWAIAPLGALLLWSQIRSDEGVADGLVATVAGLVGMVPQGLILLVSMALAVAIIRLAQNHVVVQELHAVEGLARVDVLCVDKTGTLTTGSMQRDAVEPFGATGEEVTEVLAALAAAEDEPTETLRVAAGDGPAPGWTVASQVTFTSARKWSGATFEPGGTWVLGAPEVVLDGCDPDAVAGAGVDVPARLAEHTEAGRRVVLLARASGTFDGDALPAGLEPVALVVLAEEVRPDAAETMRYFAEQGVTVKVISGDNPVTVSAVATRLEVPGADRWVDARKLDEHGSLDDAIESTTVFGRVLPHQKRELVEALQRAGHTVAMTGDGVNDIPALKKADIGIGMDTATPATKAVSQLVLLDGRFDRLPAVVAEGRRVFANMERVSSLFVTKTVYAAAFVLVVGVWGAAFPFLPRHLSLVSELTIGLPAFALSFRSADQPYRPGYLERVLRFAVPAGVATSALVLAAYAIARSSLVDLTLEEARTAATLTLLALALWVLFLVMRPIDRYDLVVLGGMIVLLTVVVSTSIGRRFYELHWPSSGASLLLGAYVLVAMAVLSAVMALAPRLPPIRAKRTA